MRSIVKRVTCVADLIYLSQKVLLAFQQPKLVCTLVTVYSFRRDGVPEFKFGKIISQEVFCLFLPNYQFTLFAILFFT